MSKRSMLDSMGIIKNPKDQMTYMYQAESHDSFTYEAELGGGFQNKLGSEAGSQGDFNNNLAANLRSR